MGGQSDVDELWNASQGAPPPQLADMLAQIAQFLDRVGYTKTSSALAKEAARSGITLDTPDSASQEVLLISLHQHWFSSHDKHLALSASEAVEGSDSSSADSSESDEESEGDEAEGILVDVEAEETSDDDSDEADDDDDTSDSGSDNSSEASSASSSISAKAGTKRKRDSSSEAPEDDSSDVNSNSSDSKSDSDDAPPTKKAKTASVPDEPSADDGSGSDSDDGSTSSESGSSSSDDSESDSDSNSNSESDDDDAKPEATQSGKTGKSSGKKANNELLALDVPRLKKASADSKDAGSLSSATLDVDSPAENETPGQMHPDRLKRLPADQKGPQNKKEAAEMKKQEHVPFSRIPTDQRVDPRFASNAYVPYDYAERAHRDLIVTKGKGFTKEKNKKKRGAYRGGAIDLTPKGIKFDD